MQRRSLLPLAVGVSLGTIAVLAPGSVDEVLEVLVIAQASLLAIVLSVSLLSVQVSTNQYAPLLSRVYREGTFNAIMARFGASILVALGLRTGLPLLGGPQKGIGLGVAAALATWSFLALFELEQRLLAFLNPEPVLEELVEEVSLARYRRFTERRREEGEVARNPLLEIFQLARTALDGNDNYGALRAVVALQRATETLLAELAELPPAEQREAVDDIHRLFDYWVQVARPTVDHGADDVLHALVDGLHAASEFAVAENDPEVVARAATALGRVCRHALEGGRLEAHYVQAFAVFADGDASVAETAAAELVDLAVADAGHEAIGSVLAGLVEAGHDDAVARALNDSSDSETARMLRDAVEAETDVRLEASPTGE